MLRLGIKGEQQFLPARGYSLEGLNIKGKVGLDAAIMRRFTFKLEFDYLDDAGKKSFFERMFKTTLTEDEFEELKTLGNLAPGDFRTVRQEAFYLDEETSNADLIAALRAECLLKKDGDTKSRIGFAG